MTKKIIINGCEARGDGETPYLTRWTLISTSLFQVCFHKFHRSDAEDLHDHPWDFITIPLGRGYIEQTPVKPKCSYCKEELVKLKGNYWMCPFICCFNQERVFITDNYNYNHLTPFLPHYRKATHQHRVILMDDKPVYTLVFMGKRKRTWGFIVKEKWIDFLTYFKINKC